MIQEYIPIGLGLFMGIFSLFKEKIKNSVFITVITATMSMVAIFAFYKAYDDGNKTATIKKNINITISNIFDNICSAEITYTCFKKEWGDSISNEFIKRHLNINAELLKTTVLCGDDYINIKKKISILNIVGNLMNNMDIENNNIAYFNLINSLMLKIDISLEIRWPGILYISTYK